MTRTLRQANNEKCNDGRFRPAGPIQPNQENLPGRLPALWPIWALRLAEAPSPTFCFWTERPMPCPNRVRDLPAMLNAPASRCAAHLLAESSSKVLWLREATSQSDRCDVQIGVLQQLPGSAVADPSGTPEVSFEWPRGRRAQSVDCTINANPRLGRLVSERSRQPN